MNDITAAPIPDRGPPPIDPTGMIAFLQARLDEDRRTVIDTVKAVADADCGDHPRDVVLGDELGAIDGYMDVPTLFVGTNRASTDLNAKQAIVDACAATAPRVAAVGTPEAATSALADTTLRHLAAVYAAHPDYRKEWRP